MTNEWLNQSHIISRTSSVALMAGRIHRAGNWRGGFVPRCDYQGCEARTKAAW